VSKADPTAPTPNSTGGGHPTLHVGTKSRALCETYTAHQTSEGQRCFDVDELVASADSVQSTRSTTSSSLSIPLDEDEKMNEVDVKRINEGVGNGALG
jgi:hypothetical protein